jgi:hypothetical protein
MTSFQHEIVLLNSRSVYLRTEANLDTAFTGAGKANANKSRSVM